MIKEGKIKIEKDQKPRTPEKMQEYVFIETAVMKRSGLESMDWANEYAKKYGGLFEKNEELFLKLYKENPEELYALIKVALEIGGEN